MFLKELSDKLFWKMTLTLALPIALQNLLSSSLAIIDNVTNGNLYPFIPYAFGVNGWDKHEGEWEYMSEYYCREHDSYKQALAYHYIAESLPALRKPIDMLEELVDNKLWPLPKYRELLFIS